MSEIFFSILDEFEEIIKSINLYDLEIDHNIKFKVERIKIFIIDLLARKKNVAKQTSY